MRIRRLGYVPSLDGLRTLAVLSVIVAHSGVGIVKTTVGVDIFFVLSGFLITHILLEEWFLTGRISIRNFYVRRILRLWPALWVMVLGTSASLYLSGMSGVRAKALGLGAIWALCYVSNWIRAFGLGTTVIYGHTWSLGVEEQFYILWALLLPLGLSTIGLVKTRRLTLGAIGVMILWRIGLFESGASISRIYNGFDTHADGCLSGCVLALFLIDPDNRSLVQGHLRAFPFIGPAALCSLVAISILLPVANDPSLYYIPGMPVIYLLSALVIADAVVGAGYVRNFLGSRSLVHFGTISYGIYLWHYPLMIAVAYAPNYISDTPTSKLLIGLIGGVGMAEGSYWLVEAPFLRLKSKIGQHATSFRNDSRLTVAAVVQKMPPNS